MSRLRGQLPEVFKRVKRQATSFKRQATLDKVTIYDYIGDMKDKTLKKLLEKNLKKSQPALAEEVKQMLMKDFKMLLLVYRKLKKIDE